jgi:ketosteroid isomerase-like protein
MKQQSIAVATKIFVILFFICSSCRSQTTANATLAEARKAITKTNTVYFDLYAKNDGSVLTLYTADACLLPPNAPAICGQAALAKDFKETYAAGIVKSGKFTTMNIYGDGKEYVTEEGKWQVFGAGDKLIDEGKYLKLWKHTKEGWKIFRDSFNSDHSK